MTNFRVYYFEVRKKVEVLKKREFLKYLAQLCSIYYTFEICKKIDFLKPEHETTSLWKILSVLGRR